jgi:integrase
MASIKKHGSGWRAQLAVLGVRESKVFSTKAEANTWSAQRETEIRSEKATGVQRGRTVDEAFRRYEKEVSVHKRGHRWEAIRLAAIGRMTIDGVALQDMKLVDVTSDILGKWRDARIKVDQVKGATVNRDLTLISHVFAVAAKEWKWIATSPTTNVRRPAESAPRDRLYTDEEIDRLCLALGFDPDSNDQADSVSQRIAVAFLFAIETAMRAGEICQLEPTWVRENVAHLPASATKNGTKRDVPLSKRAVHLLKFLPEPAEGETIFGLTTASLDALFRKARNRALVEDATFHDTRHLAITRLAQKLGVLDLARMVGHRDLRQLQVYYNETAANMAARLD